MAKKKQNSKAKTSLAKYFQYIFIVLIAICVGFLLYNFTLDNVKDNKTNTKILKSTKIKEKTKLDMNFDDMFKNLNIKDKECKINTPTCLPKKETSVFNKVDKAKLAIIIDDVATKNESDEIKKIIQTGRVLTPSFFPNTSNHPDTNKFAKEFDVYMVHLPLQAIKFSSPEPQTLNVNSDEKTIISKIDSIKNAFPKLKFINNHTGSAFTQDESAMRKLFKALEKNNLIFVDSRTIASTKAPLLAKEFNQFYIHRDVFLDNSQNLNDIKNKLDEAVRLALKKGYAIAIAHPHKNSLKAISEYDFSKINLVNIDDIYNYYK